MCSVKNSITLAFRVFIFFTFYLISLFLSFCFFLSFRLFLFFTFFFLSSFLFLLFLLFLYFCFLFLSLSLFTSFHLFHSFSFPLLSPLRFPFIHIPPSPPPFPTLICRDGRNQSCKRSHTDRMTYAAFVTLIHVFVCVWRRGRRGG